MYQKPQIFYACGNIWVIFYIINWSTPWIIGPTLKKHETPDNTIKTHQCPVSQSSFQIFDFPLHSTSNLWFSILYKSDRNGPLSPKIIYVFNHLSTELIFGKIIYATVVTASFFICITGILILISRYWRYKIPLFTFL